MTIGSIGRSAVTRTIKRYSSFRGAASLAVNDAGHAAVAYVAIGRDGRRMVKLAERRPGARFAAPRIVDHTGRGAFTVTVAVGRRGELVVAWQRGRFVEARVRPRGGRLGPVQRLGAAIPVNTTLRAAVADSGATWVQWDGAPASEGGFGPRSVRVAVRPALATRFRAARPLDRDAAWLRGPHRFRPRRRRDR